MLIPWRVLEKHGHFPGHVPNFKNWPCSSRSQEAVDEMAEEIIVGPAQGPGG